jgi:hypothetical protein
MSKKITLFLIDGLPKGIRSIRIDQWIGKAVCAPRASIKKIDFSETDGSSCIYFLVSSNEDDELLNVYVGETDVFSNRLSDHNYKKDWWQELIVFYSLDKSLTKTGVRYMEKICIERLKKAGKCNLMNGNERADANILEEDKAGLEEFFLNITTVLPLLGYDIFEQNEVSKNGKKGIQLQCKGKGALAHGILLDDGKMLVLKGSTAIRQNSPHMEHNNYILNVKNKLIEIGRLKEEGEYLLFTDDYEFSSASAAAAIILARSSSGPKEWVDENGTKLKDLLDN